MSTTRIPDQSTATTIEDTDLFLGTQNTTSVTPNDVKYTALQFSNYVDQFASTKYLPLAGGYLVGKVYQLVTRDLKVGVGDTPAFNEFVPYSGVQNVASSIAGSKGVIEEVAAVNLVATYDNGPYDSGELATLTNAGTLAVFSIPGSTRVFNVNDEICLTAQSSSFQNGLYVITDLGSGTTPWILTRADDFDGTDGGQITYGQFIYCLGSPDSTNYDSSGYLVYYTGVSDPVIGSDPITFLIFPTYQAQKLNYRCVDGTLTFDNTDYFDRKASGNYQPGTGITIIGNVISATGGGGTISIVPTNATIAITNPDPTTYSLAANYQFTSTNNTVTITKTAPNIYDFAASGGGAGPIVLETDTLGIRISPFENNTYVLGLALQEGPYTTINNTTGEIGSTLYAGENITIDTDGKINATGGGGTVPNFVSSDGTLGIDTSVAGTINLSAAAPSATNPIIVSSKGGAIQVKNVSPNPNNYSISTNFTSPDNSLIIDNNDGTIISNVDGANIVSGIAQLRNGICIVNYTAINANTDNIEITAYSPNSMTDPGAVSVTYIETGRGFEVTSEIDTDNSYVFWTVTPLNAPYIPYTSGYTTLVNGTATINTPDITLLSYIFYSVRTANQTFPVLGTVGVANNSNFTVNSNYRSDNSEIDWAFFNQGDTKVFANDTNLVTGTVFVADPSLAVGDVIILGIQSPNVTNGSIAITTFTAGSGFQISSNYAKDYSLIAYAVFNSASGYPHGLINLVNGTATVTDPEIRQSSIIFISCMAPGGITLGQYEVKNVINHTSFDIISNSIIDTSSIGWVIIN